MQSKYSLALRILLFFIMIPQFQVASSLEDLVFLCCHARGCNQVVMFLLFFFLCEDFIVFLILRGSVWLYDHVLLMITQFSDLTSLVPCVWWVLWWSLLPRTPQTYGVPGILNNVFSMSPENRHWKIYGLKLSNPWVRSQISEMWGLL